MKKSATRKSTARPARRTAKKSTTRKAEPRLRNAAASKVTTTPVIVEPEPTPYTNPSFSRRTDTHSLLPTAVARMLEEESWWRVVRVSSPEPVAIKRGSKSRRSSRTLATAGRSSSKR